MNLNRLKVTTSVVSAKTDDGVPFHSITLNVKGVKSVSVWWFDGTTERERNETIGAALHELLTKVAAEGENE